VIHVNWIDPQQTILCLEYEHPVRDWNEYIKANERAYEMMRTVSHPVHLIHHAGAVMMPSGNPFPHLRYVYNHLPPHTGDIVMVISHRFPRIIIDMALRFILSTDNLHIVETIDEAYDILNLDVDSV
jgi:hypothetical protein